MLRKVADYAYAKGAWDVVDMVPNDVLKINGDERMPRFIADCLKHILTSRGIERPG